MSSIDTDVLELYRRIQALEANRAAFTSIAKLGDIALTGAVTLSEGDNITLTEAGQNIEIAADIGLPYFFARFTDENSESPVWVSPGGRDYRARTWTNATGLTEIQHKTPGFLGYSFSAAPLSGVMLQFDGTYLITASVTATFPAQQEVREAGIFVSYGLGPDDPSSLGSITDMFDLTVGSPPGTAVEKTFQTSFVASGSPFYVLFVFGEDDINDARTTTLSTAWELEVLALQLV